MPKTPKFAVKNTPRGWKLNVPASISDTGKKQELYFTSRDKATEEAQRFRANYRANGEAATVLPPRVADDALRAWKLLEPLGITLAQAARQIVLEHDVKARSVKTTEATKQWLEAIKDRLRPSTAKSYKATTDKLDAAFGDDKLADLTGDSIARVLRGASYSLHRRNASAFWRWCAKPPRKWCRVEVFADVEAISAKNDGDIGTLTPALVERLLRVAEKHFPETVPVYAVGFFGGARVEELKRLTGDEFTTDGIELSASIAKKRRRRHIPMNDTLAAWLEKYPFAPCPNWVEKHNAVRRLAGWNVSARLLETQPEATQLGRWPRNVIRHTHASAEIANGATLEDLLFRFGHTDGPEVLRSHYVGRYTKKDAVAFWSIGPKGKVIDLLKSA